MSIPGMDAWLATPQGQYISQWEQARLDEIVNDIFGFNALQLGWPICDFLRNSRMALRRRAGDPGADVVCDLSALPVASHTCDLAILPHQLEFQADPHQILREIERILIPEGQLIIVGFNPMSLWGLNNRFTRHQDFPWCGRYLSAQRLRDWLRLLNFDVERTEFGCYAPPAQSARWFERCRFMEKAGPRWWEFAGSVYLLRATKRVPGMRLITPAWRKRVLAPKALRPIARKETHGH